MSTIITTNPYTFTVEDNMSIKAVFENAAGTIKSVSKGGAIGTDYGGTFSVYMKNGSTTIGTASCTYVKGGNITIDSNSLTGKTFQTGYTLYLNGSGMSTNYYGLGAKVYVYVREGSTSGTIKYTLKVSSKTSTYISFTAEDLGKNYYLVLVCST